ncbi:MAG: OmpH family outer membrane protein [Polyangiaceae bacterium]
MKVAVVDVQRAVMQTEDGLRAQATLKKLFDSRQQELNKKQQELGKQKEELDKQQRSALRRLARSAPRPGSGGLIAPDGLRRVQQGAREEAEGAHRSDRRGSS